MMRKTMIRFFTIADYEEEEIWLRKRHAEGWKLVEMTPPCVYTFEACEPEDVIYRLDYKNSDQTEEYMQMLEDFGWEYFAECLGWLYFRKPAKEAASEEDGELFSDPASRAEMAGDIVRTRLLPLMLIFMCCLVPNLNRTLHGGAGLLNHILSAFFGVMFVLYVFLIVYCGLKLKRIRDRNRR